jgi:hypothetical protein
MGAVLLVYTIRNWARREPPVAEGAESKAPATPISDAVNVPDAYLAEVEQDLEREEE